MTKQSDVAKGERAERARRKREAKRKRTATKRSDEPYGRIPAGNFGSEPPVPDRPRHAASGTPRAGKDPKRREVPGEGGQR